MPPGIASPFWSFNRLFASSYSTFNPIAMVRKPPCRICRSRRWRKNTNGFFICELGHQLEGFQEEVSEFDTTMGSTYQRVKKGPKRKRKVRENLITFLSGRDMDFYFLQCFQLILRKQLYVMIHELGCPAEIENVAHEFWTLYMTSLTSYQPSNDTPNENNDDSNEGDDISEQDGVDKHTNTDMTDMANESGSDATAAVAKTHPKTLKGSNNSAFKDKTDISGEEPDDLDNMDEYQPGESSSSESEDDDNDDEDDSDGNLEKDLSQKKTKGPIRKTLPSGKLLPVGMFSRNSATELMMPSSIAICYLSAQHLKLPIVMGDFYRWVMDRTVPYFNVEHYLPAEMRGKALTDFLVPKHRGIEPFHRATNNIADHLFLQLGVVPRTPNVPPMVFRFVQELMLPVEVYPCAMRLYHIYRDKSSEKQNQGQGREYSKRSTMEPIIAMAVVIIIAKLVYGLDDKRRSPPHPSSWLNSLPREADMFKSLDVFDSLQTQTKIPTLFGEFEELIKLNPDLYTEYCERELKPYPRVGWSNRPRGLLTLLAIFESTKYGDLATRNYEARPTPTIEAFIQHLHSRVPKPESHQDGDKVASPPPLKPGEGFVHYSGDETGEYLGQYKRMLSYAASILCVTTDSLQECIRRVENSTVCETIHSAGVFHAWRPEVPLFPPKPRKSRTLKIHMKQARDAANGIEPTDALLGDNIEALEDVEEDIPDDFGGMDFEDFEDFWATK